MIEIDRDIKVYRDLTLEQLGDLLPGKTPQVVIGEPPFNLNQTLYSWCEWLRFNNQISRQELDCAFSKDIDYCEWLNFWESMKGEKVSFYDYLNNIAYLNL